jgi:hypothetical protein
MDGIIGISPKIHKIFRPSFEEIKFNAINPG